MKWKSVLCFLAEKPKQIPFSNEKLLETVDLVHKLMKKFPQDDHTFAYLICDLNTAEPELLLILFYHNFYFFSISGLFPDYWNSYISYIHRLTEH